MDNRERMQRRIKRVGELCEMKSQDDAYWAIIQAYRSHADGFAESLETWIRWGEVRCKDKNGHKEALRQLLDALKMLLNDVEAMQDDAEASHDYTE